MHLFAPKFNTKSGGASNTLFQYNLIPDNQGQIEGASNAGCDYTGEYGKGKIMGTGDPENHGVLVYGRVRTHLAELELLVDPEQKLRRRPACVKTPDHGLWARSYLAELELLVDPEHLGVARAVVNEQLLPRVHVLRRHVVNPENTF